MARRRSNTRRAIVLAAALSAVFAVAAPLAAGGASPMHIGDLDGVASKKAEWQAKITITVHDANDKPLSGVSVGGAWTDGASGTAGCKTRRRGTCVVVSPSVAKGTPSITFGVMGATLPGYVYDAAGNHDPDGSSDGTQITVTK